MHNENSFMQKGIFKKSKLKKSAAEYGGLVEEQIPIKNILKRGKKIGFLFGSEASGLSNDEISYANYTLQIPTNPDFRSLNLSHSLIIIAQYIASIIKSRNVPFRKLSTCLNS